MVELKVNMYMKEDTLPQEVIDLFKEMNPQKPVEYASHILDKALEGEIDTSKEFNLYGYDYVCRQNEDKYRKSAKYAKKNIGIDFQSQPDKDAQPAPYTVLENQLSRYEIKPTKNEYEDIEDKAEIMFAINTIKNIEKSVMETDGVLLSGLIKNALSQVPSAILQLKELCKADKLIGDMVKTILSSGCDVATLL